MFFEFGAFRQLLFPGKLGGTEGRFHRLAGQRPGALLGLSALGGAALLLAADIGVRLVETQAELKLGVVTALVGGPFFLWLLLRTRRTIP